MKLDVTLWGMVWAAFHHPDLSVPVLRRRATDEVLDLMLGLGEAVWTRGYSLALGSAFPSDGAYRSAMYRLRKRGLVAYRRGGGRDPVLMLTPAGQALREPPFKPERYWDRGWRKIWYVLMYDVPEKERSYRDALRGFLRRQRMGCLQRSVWVTPHDIRPDYADLVEAGGLDAFAYLMESRTVLGQRSEAIVTKAWRFDELSEMQADYCACCRANLDRVREGVGTAEALVDLARREITAYLQVMDGDPLLPRALWPAGYRGPDVLRLHRELGAEVGRRLNAQCS